MTSQTSLTLSSPSPRPQVSSASTEQPTTRLPLVSWSMRLSLRTLPTMSGAARLKLNSSLYSGCTLSSTTPVHCCK